MASIRMQERLHKGRVQKMGDFPSLEEPGRCGGWLVALIDGHTACGQSLAPTSEKSGLQLPSHVLQVVGLLGILYVFTLKAHVKLSC